MAVEGIGARALRKEDKRFITGKGQYTDDMVMQGMGFAAPGRARRRLRGRRRSPHRHRPLRRRRLQ